MASGPTTWTWDELDLWARITAHPFEPAGQALPFTARLARDHGWSLPVARRAVEEYRRFCFLAVTAPWPMTPSEEVDEVWHLHLTYSRDYWGRWCGEVLGTTLHHQPTAGGPAEGLRFAEQYARTLAHYETRFGPPDPLLWPGIKARFGRPRFQTVDRHRTLVLSLPAWLGRRRARLGGTFGIAALLSTVTSGPASALPLNVFDWTAGPFLTLYGVLALVALGIALAISTALGSGAGTRQSVDDLGPVALAFLAGGEVRAADTLALSLIQQGHLTVGPDGVIEAAPRRGGVTPSHLASFAAGEVKRRHLPQVLQSRLDPVRDRLAARGLLLTRKAALRRALAAASPVAAVTGIGVAKILVGLSRDKPVGFLMLLTLATVVAGVAVVGTQRPATPAGRRALEGYSSRRARAMRAPLPDEIIVAFAVGGAAALAGTALAPYATVFTPPSGSDGGDGGGCGGGGGGCGGCGGGD